MKKIILSLLCISILGSVAAQERKTILGLMGEDEENISTHFFFQPQVKAAFHSDEFTSNTSTITGGKVGIILNQRFVIGLSGYAKTGKLRYQGEQSVYGIGFGYGGIYLGTNLIANSIIQPEIGLSIGYGGSSEYPIIDGYRGANHAAGFMYVEPELDFNIHISRFVALSIGATYRWIDQSNFNLIPDGKLSGFNLSTGLIFQF